MDMARSSQPKQAGEMKQVLQELESLPVARDRGFYRQALRQRGFQIVDTESTDNKTRFEAKKNGQRIALRVHFDEDTGRSTNVDVSSLEGRQEASARTSHQQELGQRDHMVQR